MAHLKATMKRHPKLSLGDAMKEAKKTYKKHGGGIADNATPVSQETGPLVNTKGAVEGFLVKTGGKRRRHRRTHKGGTLYGFGEGGGTLSDGAGRLTPTGSVADAAQTVPKTGGRRHRKTRRHTSRRR